MFIPKIDRSNGKVIQRLTSTDFYKFTMQQIFLYLHFGSVAQYRFKCRNTDVNLLEFKDEIEDEIDYLCSLKFIPEELNYLSNIPCLRSRYIDYLETFQLKRKYIQVTEKNKQLDIFMDGPLTEVSPFEIYVLKIVHEVYSRNVNPRSDKLLNEGRRRLIEKINSYYQFYDETNISPKIIDFGTRRAYDEEWHEEVVSTLKDNNILSGTSNVMLAQLYNLNPIGSMAHEFCMLPQSLVHPMDSQKVAFKNWINFYGNDLNILLSDTLGDQKFLLDYDKDLALRTNVRHDSGCPFQFGEMMINHYKSFGIDPKIKTIVFSDGLDFPKMFELEKRFKNRIKIIHGIGTSLSNDLGIKALQNVIKMVQANGFPVCKLSNNMSKAMSEDADYVTYLKSCLDKI